MVTARIRRAILPLLLLLLCQTAGAQILRDSWRHEVSFGGGMSTNRSFFVDVSYFWFPLEYVGLGAYVGINGTSGKNDIPWGKVTSTPYYDQWILTPEHQNITGLTFTPSVMLCTPALRIQALRISLRAAPGLVLTPAIERVEAEFREVNPSKPAELSNFKYEKYWLKGPQWWAWSLRAMLHFSLDELGGGIGWSLSSYDVWSTRRSGVIEGTSFSTFYPAPKPLNHNFFLYFTWKF
jgi:hypothetical protein